MPRAAQRGLCSEPHVQRVAGIVELVDYELSGYNFEPCDLAFYLLNVTDSQYFPGEPFFQKFPTAAKKCYLNPFNFIFPNLKFFWMSFSIADKLVKLLDFFWQ